MELREEVKPWGLGAEMRSREPSGGEEKQNDCTVRLIFF